MKFPTGSPSFEIKAEEIKSVGKGLLIMVGGLVATEITRQLTGANLNIHWRDFNVGPLEFTAGTYNITYIVWIAWSGTINFVRKFLTDNSQKPL